MAFIKCFFISITISLAIVIGIGVFELWRMKYRKAEFVSDWSLFALMAVLAIDSIIWIIGVVGFGILK